MARNASWNERVRYVADPERERMYLQSEFIVVLAHMHPEVFEALRQDVLPVWRTASEALQKLAGDWQLSAAQYPQLSPYSACLNAYEAAEQVPTHTQLPECVEARESLE